MWFPGVFPPRSQAASLSRHSDVSQHTPAREAHPRFHVELYWDPITQGQLCNNSVATEFNLQAPSVPGQVGVTWPHSVGPVESWVLP